MASAIRNVAIMRSLWVSRILVVMVAIVPQPRPSTIGSTALPLRPIFEKTLFERTAILGRYPLSSRNPKAMKKVAVMAG